MSLRHVLTQQSCHVLGQVPSCHFFGVIFQVSRLVASCAMVYLASFYSFHVLSCYLFPRHVVPVASLALATRRKLCLVKCSAFVFVFVGLS